MAITNDRWSEELPSTPGIYWWRYRRSHVTVLIAVAGDDQGMLWVQQATGGEVPLTNWTPGLWAGPVTPPRIVEGE